MLLVTCESMNHQDSCGWADEMSQEQTALEHQMLTETLVMNGPPANATHVVLGNPPSSPDWIAWNPVDEDGNEIPV